MSAHFHPAHIRFIIIRDTINRMTDVQYINHPLIKQNRVEQRLYQLSLTGEALKKSTLIVLPTGLGKTIIALLVMVSRLPKGKVLLLSPTKPLVEQHAAFLKNVLNILPETIVLFTGSTSPKKRASMWETAQVVVSTPQVIENDLRPPAAGEVRIKVLAASVCRPDITVRTGEALYSGTPLGQKVPFVPGYSVIGVIDALGAGVTEVAVGDRVGALTVVGG